MINRCCSQAATPHGPVHRRSKGYLVKQDANFFSHRNFTACGCLATIAQRGLTKLRSNGGCVMPEDTSKIPVEHDKETPSALGPPRPLESLRREIDQLFDDFGLGTWRSPFRSSFFDIEPFRKAKAAFSGMPAVDVTETEKGYKVTAELPGMDEKNIEVKIANGILPIKAEDK